MEKIKPSTTIIYCTANIENESLENNLRELISSNSNGLPVISVSRVPIKFGKNICVTEKASVSKGSYLRQLLKGLKAAKTDFCVIAKADTAYPPAYFSFVPKAKNKPYYYKEVYALGDKFWRKDLTDSAMMCGTKHWIKMVTKALKGHNNWKPFDPPEVFENKAENTYGELEPVVTFHTKKSFRKFPTILPGYLPKTALPIWGFAKEFKRKVENS